MFNRESIEKNYKKVNDGVPPTENEKESLKSNQESYTKNGIDL